MEIRFRGGVGVNRGGLGVGGWGCPHDHNQIRSHFGSSVVAAISCSNMASMSASSNLSGAIEHARSGASEHAFWNGALAFSNIGLSGKAVSGSKWSKHRERLVKLVVDLLTTKPLLGVLLNEVGNLTDKLDPNDRRKFTEMLTEAFRAAGYNKPTVVWSAGETVAAFRSGVAVKSLPTLTKMERVHPWRVVERFELSGATEHGPVKMLVCNNHQPSSAERPFPSYMRISFCRAILHDALRHHADNPTSCGWVFGGDANCSLAPWSAAVEEVPQIRLAFDAPSFLHGINRKNGDLIVVAGVKGGGLTVFENTCTVPGREKQHDCMYYQWCYRARAKPAPVSLPASKPRRAPTPTNDHGERQRLQEASNTPSSGATEHTRPQKEPEEDDREAPSSGATEHTRPPEKPDEDEDERCCRAHPGMLEPDDASLVSEADFGGNEGELRLLIRTQSPFLKGPMAVLVVEFWEIGLPGGLPPPRPPGSW